MDSIDWLIQNMGWILACIGTGTVGLAVGYYTACKDQEESK